MNDLARYKQNVEHFGGLTFYFHYLFLLKILKLKHEVNEN